MAEDRMPALDRHVQEQLGEKLRERLVANERDHMPAQIESLMARLRGGNSHAGQHGG